SNDIKCLLGITQSELRKQWRHQSGCCYHSDSCGPLRHPYDNSQKPGKCNGGNRESHNCLRQSVSNSTVDQNLLENTTGTCHQNNKTSRGKGLVRELHHFQSSKPFSVAQEIGPEKRSNCQCTERV